MTECEDCGESVRRRVRCWHCGLYVCPYCWHHEHRCEPGHRREDCRNLLAYKRHGATYLNRLRARALVEGAAEMHGARVSGND